MILYKKGGVGGCRGRVSRPVNLPPTGRLVGVQIPVCRAVAQMDNGKCIMDNDCIAFGDDFKLFPKEIPQLSIIHLRDSATNGNLQNCKRTVIFSNCFLEIMLKNNLVSYWLLCYIDRRIRAALKAHISRNQGRDRR